MRGVCIRFPYILTELGKYPVKYNIVLKARYLNIFCITFSFLRWLIIGVSYVMLHHMVVEDISDFSGVQSAPFSGSTQKMEAACT
jgi:hypothetical protein